MVWRKHKKPIKSDKWGEATPTEVFKSVTDKKMISWIVDPKEREKEIGKMLGRGIPDNEKTHKQIMANMKVESLAKSGAVKGIIALDMDIIAIGQHELLGRLMDDELRARMQIKDLASVVDISAKRMMLLNSELTDENGGLKIIIENQNFIQKKLSEETEQPIPTIENVLEPAKIENTEIIS